MSFSTYLRTGFYPLSFYIADEKDLRDRVQNNWANIGIVSGLIAGFTFLVISQDVKFVVPLDGPITREEIFTILTGLAFVFALTSTLMASYMHGVVNLGGAEQIKSIVQKWCIVFGVPLYCTVFSVLLLLVAAFFAIGGRYASLTVWLTIVITGGAFTVMMFIVFLTMLHGVYKHIDTSLKMHQARNVIPLIAIRTSSNNNAALTALAAVTP
jgi:hypothetical protein